MCGFAGLDLGLDLSGEEQVGGGVGGGGGVEWGLANSSVVSAPASHANVSVSIPDPRLVFRSSVTENNCLASIAVEKQR